MIGDAIEAEGIPRPLGDQRIDLDDPVRPRAQADQARDDQVAEPRMVIVAPPVLVRPAQGMQDVPRDPAAGVRVEVLVDPGDDRAVGPREVLRPGVGHQQREVILLVERGLEAILVEQVGQGHERLGGGVRPRRAVPEALVVVRLVEPGMPALGRRRPERRGEPVRVGQLRRRDLAPGAAGRSTRG